MNRLFYIISVFIFQFNFSQVESILEIKAPDLKVDSIYISYPSGARNTHLLHTYKLLAAGSKKIAEQGDLKIALKNDLKISSKMTYPQPSTISYYDAAKNSGMQSKTFFIDKGNLTLLIKDDQLNYEILSSTPANIESDRLKIILQKYNANLKPFENNDAKNIEAKEFELQKYIRKNPKSYVALWEMIDDFSKYGFNEIYFDNLKLFDPVVKRTFVFTEFSKFLKLEAESIFPDVNFDKSNQLSVATFKNYKLTLIDYWSTTCKPCIDDMPKLVALYNQYKSQGVNFISVTDEQTPERIKKANEILKKNYVSWKNYFDTNKEFPAKLNASGYPLQILVDSEGKIVKRTYGELDVISSIMQDYLK